MYASCLGCENFCALKWRHLIWLTQVPHQTTQMPVRYQHQVGNQIIPLTPANLQQKPAPSSSVAITTTTTSTVTTRSSISVQCGTTFSPSDVVVQQSVGLASQTLPKLSVVQPMLQTAGVSVTSSQPSKSTGQPSSCEKGTSPLQVQVGICARCCVLHFIKSSVMSFVQFWTPFCLWGKHVVLRGHCFACVWMLPHLKRATVIRDFQICRY